MQQFVPLIDDLEVVSPGLLVPYQVGQPCFHWEIDDAADLPNEVSAVDDESPEQSKVAIG